MKAVVAAFNQEKALVGAFSVITNLRMEIFEALIAGHLSDEGEERGGEVDRAVVINGLVHADQLLEGESVRALAAEPEGRVHVLQHVVHLRVVDAAPATWRHCTH